MTDSAPEITPPKLPENWANTQLSQEELEELDAILDDLRSRLDETPQWELCEGFLAALVCTRRPIAPDDYFAVLLGTEDDGHSFSSPEQQARFLALWSKRWVQIQIALDTEVETLDDERAFYPELLDIRGQLADQTEAEQAEFWRENEGVAVPDFAQVWAVGFMFAVESWPELWVAPKDPDARQLLDHSLDAIITLTEAEPGDGTAPPTTERIGAFGEAIWAVYHLRALWLAYGAQPQTLRAEPKPGRNEPCSCGSGKKYKKCCGG
jgi:uncharacterized protein